MGDPVPGTACGIIQRTISQLHEAGHGKIESARDVASAADAAEAAINELVPWAGESPTPLAELAAALRESAARALGVMLADNAAYSRKDTPGNADA